MYVQNMIQWDANSKLNKIYGSALLQYTEGIDINDQKWVLQPADILSSHFI